ncbi:unnamed protein product, partial [Chrysoparadoxa australica]
MALTKEVHDELCTAYAALALYDGEAEITSDQLKALINATGNEVEPYWPILFSSFIQRAGMEKLVFTVGTPGGGGGGGGGGDAAGDGGAGAEEKKVEEEEEEV